MNTYLKVKQISSANMSFNLYQKLYSLNLRKNGSMRYILVHSKSHIDTPIFYIEQKGKILSWGIFNIINPTIYQINLYTRKTHRKKGLANNIKKEMMNYLQKNNKKFMCAFVDQKNKHFWNVAEEIKGWTKLGTAI